MTKTLPILYSFRRCPYAMRARLALYTAKISHEHREVDLKNKPHDMLLISPKGTVPVLQLEDGTVIEQSLDIMKWALKTGDLQPREASLITENDSTFKEALNRYKYPGRYPEEDGVNYRDECASFINKIETQLTPFLNGNDPALIDMALFPFVRQFGMVDIAWFEEQPFPALRTWLDYFTSSALFDHVMVEHPVWTSGDEPIVVVF